MKYICESRNLPEHWYPRKEENMKLRVQVDSYLHWHHSNLRLGAAGVVYRNYFFPRMQGREASKESLDEVW